MEVGHSKHWNFYAIFILNSWNRDCLSSPNTPSTVGNKTGLWNCDYELGSKVISVIHRLKEKNWVLLIEICLKDEFDPYFHWVEIQPQSVHIQL